LCPQISEIEGNSGDPIWPEGGSGGWVDPAYDAAGNMTEGPKPGYEASADKRQFYVWDAWNRLVEVWEDTNGDGDKDAQGTDTQVLTCRYDGLGRRIQKIVEGTPDVTYDYYYNESWQVLEVRKDADTDPYEQYVWDIRYIDAPVLRDRDTSSPPNGAIDETLYYCNDANMNVTALVNTSGTVVERYVYDPYGKVTFYNGSWTKTQLGQETPGTLSAYSNDILYCGYRFDPETGLCHVRRRYYHPTLGRWASRDIIESLGRRSDYEYGAASPAVHVDPWGLSSVPVGGSAVGVPLGVGAAAAQIAARIDALIDAGLYSEALFEAHRLADLCWVVTQDPAVGAAMYKELERIINDHYRMSRDRAGGQTNRPPGTGGADRYPPHKPPPRLPKEPAPGLPKPDPKMPPGPDPGPVVRGQEPPIPPPSAPDSPNFLVKILAFIASWFSGCKCEKPRDAQDTSEPAQQQPPPPTQQPGIGPPGSPPPGAPRR
jgi:RHS repeat-associated protein